MLVLCANCNAQVDVVETAKESDLKSNPCDCCAGYPAVRCPQCGYLVDAIFTEEAMPMGIK